MLRERRESADLDETTHDDVTRSALFDRKREKREEDK
jgi:hypothetical protein